jgi:hypothetical protein
VERVEEYVACWAACDGGDEGAVEHLDLDLSMISQSLSFVL